MARIIRRVGAARFASVFLALAVLCIGLLVLSVGSHADDPPPSETVPNEEDFDDDSVQDEVVSQPSQPTETGKVDLQSGSSGTTMIRYEGRDDDDDGFGEAAAVVGDVNGDGIPDVIIGAPRDGNGIAYVMPGEKIECEVIRIEQAILTLNPIAGDYEFGFAVAPLYDYDGDQTPDVRVAAKFLDSQSNEIYRTYIFSGWTGDLLATATGAGSFAALIPIQGDSDYDADVDQDDMDRVMANLGRSGNLTRYDGDVDDDGSVGATDVALVTARQGLRAYETATASNSCPAPNCTSISPEPPTEYCLCAAAPPDDGEEGAIIQFVSGVAGGGATLTPLPGPCGQRIADCLNDPVYGPIIANALSLIDARCYGGGGAPNVIGRVYCKDCGPNEPNETKMNCGLFGPSVKVIICNDTPNFCATLAHELTHVSQGCAAGLYNNCNEFKKWAKNQYHRICAEIEAAQLAGQCSSPATCCDWACQAIRKWRNCPLTCYDCCIASWGCCANGRNTCEDNGTNPCTP